MRRRAAVLVALVAGLLGVSVPAFGLWSVTSGASSLSITAVSPVAPTITQATGSVSAHVGQVALTWSSATMPSAYTYSVTRDGSAAAGTCAGSLSQATLSCTDSGVTAGPHNYVVTATLTADTAWKASSSTSSGTVPHDFYFKIGNVPSTATAGTAFTGVTVTAADGSGLDTSYATTSHSLTITGTASPGGQTPSISPVSPTFNSGSVATISVTLVAATTGSQSFTVSDATHSGSATVNSVSVGSASQLSFSQSPAGATTATAFTTQPIVQILDADGNLTTSTAAVAVAITSGSGTSGAVLSGCSETTTAGSATFSGCKIDKTGTGYTLTASSSGLTSSTSGSFAVTAPVTFNATSLVIANGSGGTAGKPEPGDTISVSYSAPVKMTSVCTGWLSGTIPVTVAMGNGQGSHKNDLTVTNSSCTAFNFANGAITTPSSQWITGNSTASWTSTMAYISATNTLQITLGVQTGTTLTAAGATTYDYTPDTGILNASGTAVAASAVTSANTTQY